MKLLAAAVLAVSVTAAPHQGPVLDDRRVPVHGPHGKWNGTKPHPPPHGLHPGMTPGRPIHARQIYDIPVYDQDGAGGGKSGDLAVDKDGNVTVSNEVVPKHNWTMPVPKEKLPGIDVAGVFPPVDGDAVSNLRRNINGGKDGRPHFLDGQPEASDNRGVNNPELVTRHHGPLYSQKLPEQAEATESAVDINNDPFMKYLSALQQHATHTSVSTNITVAPTLTPRADETSTTETTATSSHTFIYFPTISISHPHWSFTHSGTYSHRSYSHTSSGDDASTSHQTLSSPTSAPASSTSSHHHQYTHRPHHHHNTTTSSFATSTKAITSFASSPKPSVSSVPLATKSL
ncbi:hypothetical protein F5Y16DRAFT_400403 [Xylariaceae sp. FL0255]|nr:hypothetical protein F5Y16DRAFT_400403 [Xylariaceae sp. FL0255]